MFSIFDCNTHARVSDQAYSTFEEANHDYHMNGGHTYIGSISSTLSPAIKSGDELAIEALGRRATDCELEAASYGEHSWERRMLLERAAQYREQQAEVLCASF